MLPLLLGIGAFVAPSRPPGALVVLPRLPIAVFASADASDAEAAAASGDDDKGLTGSIIAYDDLSEEFKELANAALKRRDRARVLEGKTKYGSVQGMVEAYTELGKEKGWTPEEAESEVVRYLQRQALRDEGGLDGAGQELPTFVLLGLLVVSIVYGLLSGSGGSFELPPGPWSVVSGKL